jgi:hypothetical protein
MPRTLYVGLIGIAAGLILGILIEPMVAILALMVGLMVLAIALMLKGRVVFGVGLLGAVLGLGIRYLLGGGM